MKSGREREVKQGGSQQLRRRNRSHLLQLLRGDELTRSELSSASGLTGAAVSRITRELIEVGLLQEKKRGNKRSGAGRRSVALAIDPGGVFVIGVTITANRLSVAISDHTGSIINQTEIRLADTHNAESVLNNLVLATSDLIDACQAGSYGNDQAGKKRCRKQNHDEPKFAAFDRNRLAGIGISMAISSGDSIKPASDDCIVVSSRALGWINVDVAGAFAEKFDLPVEVEPRAVAILRSEASGIKGMRGCLASGQQPTANSAGHYSKLSFAQSSAPVEGNVFLVNVGLGLGTATRIDQSIYGCSSNRIGDLTHLAHPDSSLLCECGRQGCLQHVATGAATVRAMQLNSEAADNPVVTVAGGHCGSASVATTQSADQRKTSALSKLNPALDCALQLAESGDAGARRALFDAGSRLAFGLDVVHALLGPDQIVLAGAVGRQQDYVAGVRSGLNKYGTPLDPHQLHVSQSTSSVAAVSIALEAFVFSDRLNLTHLQGGRYTMTTAPDNSTPGMVV